MVLGACVGVVYATSYGFGAASATTSVEWHLVDVPPHTSVAELADRLSDMGIIRSKVCFLAAARLSGESGNILPGQYKLSPSMSPVDIVEKFARGQVATEWVVIPEGSTLRDIEQLLQDHALAHRGRFEQAVKQVASEDRRRLHLTAPTIEGYLFPDTYHFTKTESELSIVRQMAERFQSVVLDQHAADIRTSTTGLSFPQSLILASLVEKEARHDEERAHIAGVLLSRLRAGMRLQCDATIEYILPERKAHLSGADLQLPSPYNTYLHRGLPPSPIASPGLASILAALHPAATHDLYYVAGPDGYHIFGQTLEEHNRNRIRVQQMASEKP